MRNLKLIFIIFLLNLLMTASSKACNLLNIDISVPDNKESTARGVAILAGVASNLFDLNLITKQKRDLINPDADAHAFMSKDYKRWKELILKLLSP